MNFTGDIKPIQTRYRNWICRSRLEGRWLKFLDCLGIEFEYETEGLVIDGKPYLPDLFLPKVKMWAEIKGTYADQTGWSKCRGLADHSGMEVLYLVGPPDMRMYRAAFPGMRSGDEICYSLDIHDGQRYYFDENRFYCGGPDDFGGGSSQYKAAIQAALSERFDGLVIEVVQ